LLLSPDCSLREKGTTSGVASKSFTKFLIWETLGKGFELHGVNAVAARARAGTERRRATDFFFMRVEGVG
jgi:hypothetical protein